MRPTFHALVPVAITVAGLVFGLSAPASADEIDPASAVRGSLGSSLEELSFGTGAGAAVFLINAGFVLLLAAVAIGARRKNAGGPGRIPFKRTSYFAR